MFLIFTAHLLFFFLHRIDISIFFFEVSPMNRVCEKLNLISFNFFFKPSCQEE